MTFQNTFKRYEKKFLLTPAQYEKIFPFLNQRMTPDHYGLSTICNIYFDTNTYDLIRTSIDSPPYKEKFRLRSYGTPTKDDIIFAEIKKKYHGVVYKRRVAAPPKKIDAFLKKGQSLAAEAQIQREIQWFLRLYQPVPKVFIAYERIALAGTENPELRITFDQNLRWRQDQLTLSSGMEGSPILSEEKFVMEIKTPTAMPLWLTDYLSENKIYSTSFSKYGTCYQQHLISERTLH